ncbi:hypothetical protein Bca4012_021169 [Brassica carinata]
MELADRGIDPVNQMNLVHQNPLVENPREKERRRGGGSKREDDAEEQSVQGPTEEEDCCPKSPWKSHSNSQRYHSLESLNDFCFPDSHLLLRLTGRRYMKPSKTTKESDTDRELTKFINHCNEVKAANAACKEGGQLNILKAESQAEPSKKKSAK